MVEAGQKEAAAIAAGCRTPSSVASPHAATVSYFDPTDPQGEAIGVPHALGVIVAKNRDGLPMKLQECRPGRRLDPTARAPQQWPAPPSARPLPPPPITAEGRRYVQDAARMICLPLRELPVDVLVVVSRPGVLARRPLRRDQIGESAITATVPTPPAHSVPDEWSRPATEAPGDGGMRTDARASVDLAWAQPKRDRDHHRGLVVRLGFCASRVQWASSPPTVALLASPTAG